MTSEPYVAAAAARRTTPRKVAGVRERHKGACRSRDGARCSCTPTWQADVFDKATGKRIARTFSTRSAAKAWRTDAIVALRRGEMTSVQAPTVAAALAELLDGMRDGKVLNRSGEPYKPGTIRTYGYAVRDVLTPRLGHLRLHEVRRREVQGLIDRMRADGQSASQVRNTLDPLRVMYRRALRDDVVTRSPVEHLDLPALRSAPRQVPSPAQVEGRLAALPEQDRALWATAFYAGLRRGELRAIRWDDVDLTAGVLSVRHGWDDVEGEQSPKSRAGVRDVPVIPQLRRLLAAHKLRTGRSGDALVFGRTASAPFSTSTIDRRSRTAWKDADLPPLGLHLARHACVSFMAAAGVPVKDAQTFAGHSDYRTTMGIYAHTLPGAHAEAAAQVGRFLEQRAARD